MSLLAHYNDWVVIVLMMAGLYIVISTRSFLKKVVGLNLFQTSVIIFYISMANVTGAAAPIVTEPVDVSDSRTPFRTS
jgi:multicomponent Na+:H+ antiporter subunit C